MATICTHCDKLQNCDDPNKQRPIKYVCGEFTRADTGHVDGVARGPEESPRGPEIPARIVVAQSMDALSHGNVSGSVQQAVRGKSLLPLPCGVGLILDRKGRVVGSGEPQGRNAITCSRVIVDRIEGIESTMREASKIFHEIGDRLGKLEQRIADMEENRGRMVAKMRDQLVSSVDEQQSRSRDALRTEIRAEVKRECDNIWKQCTEFVRSYGEGLRKAIRNERQG